MRKPSLGVLVVLIAIAIVVGTSMSATASETNVTVTNVTISPESVEVGEDVTITATVENVGNITENVTIVFEVNEEEVKSVNVTVNANATEIVNCIVAQDEPGTYDVTVGGASATFTVTAPRTPIPSPTLSPTPIVTPTLIPTLTPTPTETPPIATPTPEETPTPTPTPAGFEAGIAIAGLLAVTYILIRKGWKK